MEQDAVRIHVCLPADTAAPRRARAVLQDERAFRSDDMLFLLRLLVTELVSNAVEHAGLDPNETIGLTVEAHDGTVHVVVRDKGVGVGRVPAQPTPAGSKSGRGLALVAALADRWGLSVEGGSTVWFELDCDGYGDPLNFTAKLSRLSDAHAASVD